MAKTGKAAAAPAAWTSAWIARRLAAAPTELWAAIGALVTVALASGLVYAGYEYAQIRDSALYIAIIAAGLVACTLISGRLTEFTGPGGWGAKFRESARAAVQPSVASVEGNVAEMQTVSKMGVRDLYYARLSNLQEGAPIVLLLTVGQGHTDYAPRALLEYIAALGQFRHFKFVAIVDDNGRFVAYAPSWAVERLLRTRDGNDFVAALNEARLNELRSSPILIVTTLTTEATNVEALEEMEKRNLEALIVVDPDTDRPAGVVERDRLLSQLLLRLAGGR